MAHRARRSLLEFLQDNGFSLRVDIATATDLPHPTQGHHLTALDRLEVITGSGR